MEPNAESTATASAAKTSIVEAGKDLRVGDVYKNDKGDKMVVWFMASSGKARVAPLDSELKHAKRESDGLVQFMANKPGADVPPGTRLDLVDRLGRDGLAQLIDERKSKEPEKAPKKSGKGGKKAKAKTSGIRAGSLGTYQGFSIASVVRTLAKEGWNFKEIRAWFDKEKITSGDQTIKINIYRMTHNREQDIKTTAPLKTLPAKPKIAAPEKIKVAVKGKTPAKSKDSAKAPAKAKAKPSGSSGDSTKKLEALKAKAKSVQSAQV